MKLNRPMLCASVNTTCSTARCRLCVFPDDISGRGHTKLIFLVWIIVQMSMSISVKWIWLQASLHPSSISISLCRAHQVLAFCNPLKMSYRVWHGKKCSKPLWFYAMIRHLMGHLAKYWTTKEIINCFLPTSSEAQLSMNELFV